MPRMITSGEKSKNPGRKFLVFDPSIAGELTKDQQALYDAQKALHMKANAATDAFVAKMKADAKAAGNTSEIAVLLQYGKVSITLDDGRAGKVKAGNVPADAVDWTKVGAALA